MVRRFWSLVGLVGLMGLACGSWLRSADSPPSRVGKAAANFTLKDPRTGKAVSLADFKDKKAVVVVFTGTECPINNAYLPRLAQLQKDYAAKGVQFLAINANAINQPRFHAIRLAGAGIRVGHRPRRRPGTWPGGFRHAPSVPKNGKWGKLKGLPPPP